jgi:hypothetical protein
MDQLYADIHESRQRTVNPERSTDTSINDKACRMLAKMGWSEGQGLGKQSQVIQEQCEMFELARLYFRASASRSPYRKCSFDRASVRSPRTRHSRRRCSNEPSMICYASMQISPIQASSTIWCSVRICPVSNAKSSIRFNFLSFFFENKIWLKCFFWQNFHTHADCTTIQESTAEYFIRPWR